MQPPDVASIVVFLVIAGEHNVGPELELGGEVVVKRAAEVKLFQVVSDGGPAFVVITDGHVVFRLITAASDREVVFLGIGYLGDLFYPVRILGVVVILFPFRVKGNLFIVIGCHKRIPAHIEISFRNEPCVPGPVEHGDGFGNRVRS